MAKRDNDATYQKFVADLLSAVPADQRAAIKQALDSEDVKKVAAPRVLAQDDYSRLMDEGRSELQTARAALDGELSEANKKIVGWGDWYKTASGEFAQVKDKLTRYESEFGPLDGTTGQPAKKYVTEEEISTSLAKTLQERDAFAIDTSVLLADLGDTYRDTFGVRLNRKELIDFATKNNLRLDVAYDRYVAPKLQEKQTKEFDVAIAKAKVEGAREFAAANRLPVIVDPAGAYTASYADTASISRNSAERVANAVADFNGLTNQ